MRLLYLIAFISFLQVDVFYAQNENSNGLKAILIVGHQEDGTRSAIQEMDEIANVFLENGIVVHKFYDDKAEWNNIVEIAKKCNFFVYSGHGSNMGVNGNAGGICINSMVSSYELIKSLRLKENALVIFKSVCGGAGFSAGDNTDIGISEAKKRVTYYSYPFFKIGASAYYAINIKSGVRLFLNNFLSGRTLKDSFLSTINEWDDWTNIEFEELFSRDKSKNFSISSTNAYNFKTYDIAYVGQKDFTIYDMGTIKANITENYRFNNEELPPVSEVYPPKSDPKVSVKTPVVDEKIEDQPDEDAEFNGGAAAMMKWINDNINYPQTSIEMNEQGRVFIKFVVEKDGSITNVKVERGVSTDLDREAKRVIRKMPKWKAAKLGNKSVRSTCYLPINFRLN